MTIWVSLYLFHRVHVVLQAPNWWPFLQAYANARGPYDVFAM